MKKDVCRDCKERKVGCHADCEKYNTWAKANREEKRELRNNELALEARWNYGRRFQG